MRTMRINTNPINDKKNRSRFSAPILFYISRKINGFRDGTVDRDIVVRCFVGNHAAD